MEFPDGFRHLMKELQAAAVLFKFSDAVSKCFLRLNVDLGAAKGKSGLKHFVRARNGCSRCANLLTLGYKKHKNKKENLGYICSMWFC